MVLAKEEKKYDCIHAKLYYMKLTQVIQHFSNCCLIPHCLFLLSSLPQDYTALSTNILLLPTSFANNLCSYHHCLKSLQNFTEMYQSFQLQSITYLGNERYGPKTVSQDHGVIVHVEWVFMAYLQRRVCRPLARHSYWVYE